jgi:hypothetical protein
MIPTLSSRKIFCERRKQGEFRSHDVHMGRSDSWLRRTKLIYHRPRVSPRRPYLSAYATNRKGRQTLSVDE